MEVYGEYGKIEYGAKDKHLVKAEGKVEKFNVDEIMQHFDDALKSIEEMFATAESLIGEGKEDEAKNIWRAQIVLLASALDFYMHELTKYGLDEIREHKWESTASYEALPVPMRYLEAATDKDTGEDEKNAWFLEYVNEHFIHTSMISYGKVEEQLNLLGIGVRKVADIVYSGGRGDLQGSTSQKRSNPARLKEDLGEFCDRRNHIAHQTDRSSANAKELEITRDAVSGYISYISTLVKAIDAVARTNGKKSA